MTIPLSGAGGFFTRAGHIFGGSTDLNSLAGSAIVSTRVTANANFPNRVINTISPDYANGTAIPQIIQNLQTQTTTLQNQLASMVANLCGPTQIAQNTLVAMYNIDQKAVPNNAPFAVLTQLPSGGLLTVLTLLIQQMNSAGASIQSVTAAAGAQTAVGTPVGNPIIVMSVKSGQALALQYMIPETLNFFCTADAQTGGRTAGNEQITVIGQQVVSNFLSPLWPGGSGIALPLSLVPPTNNSNGNLSWNSDWTTFTTANAPDNWNILAGLQGTTIFNGGSGNAYTPNGGSLQFTGDVGGTLISVAQPFNTTPSTALNAGGTSGTLLPNTTYHGNVWYKVSATPSAGVLQASLIDGNNNIITDVQGGNNAATQSLTAATSTYANFNYVFHTPNVLPSTAKLRYRLSTAIDSAKSLFLGRHTFTPATQIYNGGAFCSIHSGSANTIAGPTPDQWTVAITNSYETSGTGLMAFWMDRTFGLRAFNLVIPNAASPTIADTLIA